MFLTETEADAIQARAAAVEARTGAQVVAAIVAKSDVYAELPWKAFALGAALAGLAVVARAQVRPDGPMAGAALAAAIAAAIAILGAGAASALLAVFVPAYARLFLGAARRELEVRVHAQSLFLRHGLFQTQARNGVLLLVSRFERKIEIVADTGLHDRVSERDWKDLIARMVPSLAAARFADALLEGLARVEELLVARGFQGPPRSGNELPDRPLDQPEGP